MKKRQEKAGKLSRGIVAVSFSILLFLCFLSTALVSVGLTKVEHDSAYRRHHSADLAGISDEKLASLSNEIFLFLDGRGTLNTDDFSSTARAHMDDVEELFRLLKAVFGVSLGGVLLILMSYDNRRVLLCTSSFVILGILALLGIAFLVLDFSKLFILFHEISFSNDLWILDPNVDVLIRMLPESLFQDLATKVVLRTVLLAVCSSALSFLWVKRSKMN